MALSETHALAILSEELQGTYRASSRGAVRLGIGDDAAVLKRPGAEQVWTVDACQEGAHFLWHWMSPEDVAHKSFHAALSDVPAMGAHPTAALCQLTLSPQVSASWLRRFARAQADVARAAKTPLIGGNFTVGSCLGVVTTVLGQVETGKAFLRSAALPGDEIWLFGELGLARAGYLLLEKNRAKGRLSRAKVLCLEAFRRPQAQLASGRKLRGRARACLDVSDGLLRDAPRVAEASSVRLVLDKRLLERTLHFALEEVSELVEETPFELALQGGEDYALLATGPASLRPRGARCVGRIEAGSGSLLDDGTRLTPLGRGFEHGG